MTKPLTPRQKRDLLRSKELVTRALIEANTHLNNVHEELMEGDMNEKEFFSACSDATRLIILRARLTSLEVMK